MAEINDFLSFAAGSQIRESFDKGRHIEWIATQSVFIEEILRSFLYISLRQKDDYNVKEIIKGNLTAGLLIKMCSIKELITPELRSDLQNFYKIRNLILHNLITKNEKLEKVNLEELYKLAEKCAFELVKCIIQYTKARKITDEFANKLEKIVESKDKINKTGK